MRSCRPRLSLAVALAVLALAAACAAEPTPSRARPSATPSTTTSPSDSPPGSPVTTPDPRLATARAFEAMARGTGTAVPSAGDVAVLFDGDPATSVPADRVDDPPAWAVCNPAQGYALRACPIDVTSYLREGVLLSDQPAREPCSRPHGLRPADVGATDRVTLVADTQQSCLDYAAVELHLDDRARLVAVNLVLGSP